MRVYDLIVIGAGPAGITASVYAARKRLDFLVISLDIGGQAAWSGEIENYTGYQFISGPDLAQKFQEHMLSYDTALKENEEVLELERSGGTFTVKTSKAQYQSRSVIIASGKRSRKLMIPGEDEFKNRGLTYCATCDGPLFSGKTVAVIGGGNSALDAVLQMIRIARQVYLVNNAPGLGGDQIMRQKVQEASNLVIFNDCRVTAVTGDKFVSGITIRDGSGSRELPVQGVFVEIGLDPNSSFAAEVEKNGNGEIKVNLRNETNIPGIFAAGDVTDVPEKQIIIAAGEGSKAALSAFRYLLTK
ncbi:MAG: FAD-dependent oxidoreductase [Candidatus Omnitrophica bacterium]|nr:FAD-dependent oxidoreductase [Candidatus Omnitrophota bacterium]